MPRRLNWYTKGSGVHRFAAASVCAAFAAHGVLAGPLTPPNGAVQSTYKTLTDVEPRTAINVVNTPGDVGSVYRINVSGSYYLPANFFVTSGKTGILVAATGVTIDLNGFQITGLGGAVAGVGASSGSVTRVTVRNGRVLSCSTGISLGANEKVALADMVVEGGGTGMQVGDGARIDNCAANGSGGTGIALGAGGVVTGCAAADNSGAGFTYQGACALTACAARGNGGIGFSGGSLAAGVFSDCVALDNTNGFASGGTSTYVNCNARQNRGVGFSSGSEALIATNCTAFDNAGSGFSTSLGQLTNCTAYLNGASGFVINQGMITGCTAISNGQYGIRSVGTTVVTRNSCASNASGGINIDSSNSRVEGNHVDGGAIGIQVNGSRNLVIGNACSATTRYLIAANNVYGAIIDRTANAAAAASGSSAASTAGTTDPWANFAF